MIDDVFAVVGGDRNGGANGSIIGRTTFQPPKRGRSTCLASSQRSSGRWSIAILTKRRGRGEGERG